MINELKLSSLAEQGCEFGSWKKIGFKINLGTGNHGLAAAPWRASSEVYLGGAARAGVVLWEEFTWEHFVLME